MLVADEAIEELFTNGEDIKVYPTTFFSTESVLHVACMPNATTPLSARQDLLAVLSLHHILNLVVIVARAGLHGGQVAPAPDVTVSPAAVACRDSPRLPFPGNSSAGFPLNPVNSRLFFVTLTRFYVRRLFAAERRVRRQPSACM